MNDLTLNDARGDMAELVALLAAKEAEIAQLKAGGRASSPVFAKVAKCGGISVYGLNARFPVTLYQEQWIRLFANADKVKALFNTLGVTATKPPKK